jgi:uncharacterized protein YjaZ
VLKLSVSKTNILLRDFIKRRKEVSPKHYFRIQQELLCEPIAEHFEEFHASQLHKYFLENGMFYPDAKIFNEIKQLEKKRVWDLLQVHYEKLKNTWDGEDAEIYTFPAEKRNEIIMKELNGKMGISFHNVVVLFLTKDLTTKEIKALFTHEYNHVCRLAVLQKEFNELSLLDSMIIEGMAEVAVEQTLGEDMLAPWVSLYTKKELLPFWKKAKAFLNVKGKEKHDPFLYGDKSGRGFPKWFGYSLGYLIVKSYLEKNNALSMNELLRIETQEILDKSGFDSDMK